MPHRPATRTRYRLLFALELLLGVAAAAGTAPPEAAPPPPAEAAAASHRLQLAVLPVDLAAADSAAARAARAQLQERLPDLLFQEGGYGVVERMDPAIQGPIMAELAFQNGGLVAPQEAKELGRLAGIDVFVAAGGDLTAGMWGSVLTLRVRLIDVQTSKLLGVFQVRGKGRPRLDAGRSAQEAVGAALDALAQQLRAFRIPSAESR